MNKVSSLTKTLTKKVTTGVFAVAITTSASITFSSESAQAASLMIDDALMIDDYSAPSFNKSSIDSSSSDFGPDSSVTDIGGGIDRLTDLEASPFRGAIVGDAMLETKPCTLVSMNCMAYSSDTGVLGEFKVGYDFGTAGFDLTNGRANDTILLIGQFADFAANLSIFAQDTRGGMDTLVTLGTPANINRTTMLSYAFASFPAVDFSTLQTLSFQFDTPTPSTDLEFSWLGSVNSDNIRPIPEPLTILGTLVAGGIGTVMKKRQKAQ